MSLWLIIIVAVVLYIIADACFDVSAKISKRLGALPSLAGIGANVASFWAKNWLRIAVLGGLVAALPLGCLYIEGRGADKVVAQVERQNAANVERAGRAQVGFERDVRETMEAAVVRELEISEEFRDVERAILEAEGRDGIAGAHGVAVERLRERAATRHAARVSDFLSSIGAQPM